MKAGSLRHPITIERFTDSVDDFGTPTKTWAPHVSLRAEIIQQSAEEFIRAQGAVDERIVILRTRFVPGLTAADRVVWKGTPHSIREITVTGHDRGLEIRTATLE
jgi:SPP1 family predicted phage head-tail adaptor